MSIELSKCNCGGEVQIAGGLKRFGHCHTGCGICGPEKDTDDEAALAWNELCEQIRVGKVMLKAIPDGFEWDTSWSIMEHIEGPLIYRCLAIRPAPAPVLDPLDVLRECKNTILGNLHPDCKEGKATVEHINTVLAQAPASITHEGRKI